MHTNNFQIPFGAVSVSVYSAFDRDSRKPVFWATAKFIGSGRAFHYFTKAHEDHLVPIREARRWAESRNCQVTAIEWFALRLPF
jgi:hypothetical protein